MSGNCSSLKLIALELNFKITGITATQNKDILISKTKPHFGKL